MVKRISRRRMILNTSLAGAGVWLSSGASVRSDTSPNEKLNIALIGAGG